MALLDCIVTVQLERLLSLESISTLRQTLDHTAPLLSAVIENDAENLKSRQYIMWITAKILVENYCEVRTVKEKSDLPGLFLTNIGSLEQVYVPLGSEVPKWRQIPISDESFSVLQLMLKAAREIGDIQTQAFCLRSLIIHSQSPTRWFDELIDLQRNVQYNARGCFWTCLAKFIACRDLATRDLLREDILSFKEYSHFEPDIRWARCMILRALAHTKREANLLLYEALTIAQYQQVGQITDYMVNAGFLEPQTAAKKDITQSGLQNEVEVYREAFSDSNSITSKINSNSRARELAGVGQQQNLTEVSDQSWSVASSGDEESVVSKDKQLSKRSGSTTWTKSRNRSSGESADIKMFPQERPSLSPSKMSVFTFQEIATDSVSSSFDTVLPRSLKPKKPKDQFTDVEESKNTDRPGK